MPCGNLASVVRLREARMAIEVMNRRDFLRVGAASLVLPALSARRLEAAEVPGLSFTRVEPGRFWMGSKSLGTTDQDPPAQEVTISRPFLISTTTVTQRVHSWLMGTAANPSRFRKDPDQPVDSLSWLEAVRFCNALSERVGLPPAFAIEEEVVRGLPSEGFRLPLEAEWEYACRAGTQSVFCCGDEPDSLKNYAWFGLGADGPTRPVAGKRANAWGLFDVHGNVDEWCWDWFGPPALNPGSRTPAGPVSGVFKVIRGGSYLPGAAGLRASTRGRAVPRTKASTIGLRLVRSVPT